MSVKYIKLIVWLVFAGVLGAAAGMVTPKKPGEDDYTVSDVGLPPAPAEKHKKDPYKSVVQFRWVHKKPVVKPVRTKPNRRRGPVCHYTLTKIAPTEVLSQTHFQLAHKKTGLKSWYKEGDGVYEGEGNNLKKVGEIVELMEKRSGKKVTYTVLLRYKQVEFPLKLEAESGFKGPKKSNRLSLSKSLKKLDGLAFFEGRQTGANSYELNKDFFDAMLANTVTEVDKLRFAVDDPLKIELMGKQSVLRKFGLKPGDRLVSFGGERIHNPEDVAKAMLKWRLKNNGTAKFQLRRGSQSITKKFKILDNPGKYKRHFTE